MSAFLVQIPPGAAYLVVELPSGREIRAAHPEVLSQAVLPGSIAKIAALAAALESRVVTARTALPCRRDITIGGHRLTCVHPDLGRPLTPAEALAHSCNSYFAAVAARIPRAALNAQRIALGLVALDPRDPIVAAALGLEGPRVAPRALVRLLARILPGPEAVALRPETRDVLIEGLRGAATFGTAAALRVLGGATLAKTGTAPMPGGGYLGLVVVFHPTDSRSLGAGSAPASESRTGLAVVVVAAGAAGRDAAEIARELLRNEVTRNEERGTSRERGAARGAGAPGSDAPGGVQGSPPLREVDLRVGETTASGYRSVTLPLEDYVARAVAGEAAPGAPRAALEAQAIVARTFALAHRGRHAREGFDVCDLTHCQALRPAGEAAREAARTTAGRFLSVGGRPARVWFSASCGGHTALPREIWPGEIADGLTYLVSRAEPECGPASRWRADIAERDLGRALRAAGLRGDRIRSLTVAARTGSNRVARLRVDGFDPPELSAEAFRLAIGRSLGWNRVRSHLFTVARTANGYAFDGSGFGHGVGLCVAGAGRMAASGASAEHILRAYFPGAAVRSHAAIDAAPAGIRLELPESDARERKTLVALIDRAIADLRARAGLGPPDLTIRFHPTVESFRRSTGQPWWIAGSTRGDRIEVLPASVLRARGTLDATLRHELAHASIDEALRDRPLWVREGAAMYFAGERGAARGKGVLAASCPSDAQMRAAATPDAMREVYARAVTCFARDVAAGKPWREIGKTDDEL